jgi:hypothetical protein
MTFIEDSRLDSGGACQYPARSGEANSGKKCLQKLRINENLRKKPGSNPRQWDPV